VMLMPTVKQRYYFKIYHDVTNPIYSYHMPIATSERDGDWKATIWTQRRADSGQSTPTVPDQAHPFLVNQSWGPLIIVS
jgi:hypothetical protein